MKEKKEQRKHIQYAQVYNLYIALVMIIHRENVDFADMQEKSTYREKLSVSLLPHTLDMYPLDGNT